MRGSVAVYNEVSRSIRQFLQAIPDGPLLEGLRNQRGRGRNDYPVQVLGEENDPSRSMPEKVGELHAKLKA